MEGVRVWARQHPSTMGFALSGASVATGVVLTNWVDVIKVRQQTAGYNNRNFLATGFNVVRHEGVLSLYRGCTAAVARGVLYGGLRIGLYSPVKTALGADEPGTGVHRKIAAGMLSGAVAAAACNPTDLVKTRMQTAGARQGVAQVVRCVVAAEGWAGLWRGTTPSMARAALLTAGQCATYDEVKLLFTRDLGWEDTLGTHFAVSGVTGLVTTTLISPVDMVKTSMFVGERMRPWACAKGVVERHGLRGLFRGWTANWARQGPMTTVIFVTLEGLRHGFGMDGI
ncbi:UCP2A [Auxenochlorella protothecoides x Auxenochlorella symbiontica]